MRWEKLGRIFVADGQRDWLVSHSSVPVAQQLDGTNYRIFFSPRDRANRSQIACLDLDIRRPGEARLLGHYPLLGPGPLGQFDDCGAMTSCRVVDGSDNFHLYIGWTIRSPVPFHNSIGLARELPGADCPILERMQDVPVLDRTPALPYFASNPFVMRIGPLWRAWFIAGTGWLAATDTQPPSAKYCVYQASSPDLRHWTVDPRPVIALGPDELAIARPMVVNAGGIWHMWYCYRSATVSYRMGYARSEDGATWTRHDGDAGLAVSKDGWDSEMVCYPFVFQHDGRWLMLYCGNGFSRDGFGLAQLTGDLA